jgi:hypothetical protein
MLTTRPPKQGGRESRKEGRKAENKKGRMEGRTTANDA